MSIAQKELFDGARGVQNPQGYRGLHAFHKYWGKKPLEPLSFLIEHLTAPDALVVDPFMGSCAGGVATIGLARRFIGFDINPISVRLARLLLSPPQLGTIESSFDAIKHVAKERIEQSYHSGLVGGPVTHYLWEGDTLLEVWVAKRNQKDRRQYAPTDQDLQLATSYRDYQTLEIRPLQFFNNSRINANPNLQLNDLFTGRALRNLDILLESISMLPCDHRASMELVLTAAVGQMSKMVFAISGRGKTSGIAKEKIEVGSWVIGFWRPMRHFEVNVWNCFERRVKKLVSALKNTENTTAVASVGCIPEVLNRNVQCAIEEGDALTLLNSLPDHSIDLLLTDPPHGDRIPYLELSELWNALLGFEVDFSSEIIVSNAKERGKTVGDYNLRMKKFAQLAAQKMSSSGTLVVLFNTRDASSWDFFSDLEASGDVSGLKYVGHFPLIYSAGSVVQDNRAGSLKTDFALVFSSRKRAELDSLENLRNWSNDRPRKLRKE